MNSPAWPAPQLILDLRSFVIVCEELLALAVEEHQSLTSPAPVDASRFVATRKDLLGRLNAVLVSTKNWRQVWGQRRPSERTQHPEVKALLEVLQQMIVRILQLDRENQQALLRAGRLPARHLPAPAAQQPGFVARLYSRHTSS